MTSKRATRGTLRCTMTRDTLLLLLCYLFTCCIHHLASCVSPSAVGSPPISLLHGAWAADTGPSLVARPEAHRGALNLLGPNEHLKHDNVHKLMSEQDLRRTFQVDSHDQVPEYEILKLTVNNDGSHLISPISDLGELTTTVTTIKATTTTPTNTITKQDKSKPEAPTSATTSGAQETPPEEEKKSQQKQQPRTTNTSAIRHKRSSEAEAEADLRQSQEAIEHKSRRDTSANAKATGEPRAAGRGAHEEAPEEERIIVMKLDKFGRNIRLRLKRNADFQQRMKGMKMFIAESTEGGRLKYTEIKSSKQQAAGQQPQQKLQHPKEVEEGGKPAESQTGGHIGSSSVNSNVWNIGSTYHDEDNLAALLIDHDRLTGQLQVDGTIGNDFVIKPLPQATYQAMLSRQQQAAASQGEPLESSSSSAPVRANRSAGPATGAQLERAISHMHDDDPHDDDEMFLDEDEALELVHLMSGAGNATSARHPQHKDSGAGSGASAAWASRAQPLSKAQSERKWRKLRKLMAQHQHSANTSSNQHQVPKWAPPGEPHLLNGAAGSGDNVLLSSHHIVYRQRPSSEGSSSEHRHSSLSGGLPSMDSIMGQLSGKQQSPPPQRLVVRRHTGSSATGPHHLNMIDEQDATDFQEDSQGGQFDMEPGSVTGSGRAGYGDWSLLGPGSLPLSALNSSFSGAAANSTGRPRFKREAGGQVRRKRQAPDTVWPEVLLVVDYDSFILHGGDSRDVKRYFVSFWNGVDLRYKLLVHPHIRISLAGMIVAKDRDATPYLERNRLRAPNADAVDAAGALTDMGKYLYREDRLPTYDLAVVITKLDMCRRRYEGGRCNRGTAGFAYVGGACVVNKRLEKVNSVAIIEDSGGFSGIIVAAHEVGHLLGCVHDGSPPPSYLGGPGATLCPWEEGFIMSDLRHTERGFRWSQCSVEQFKHFLNGETATCLYNYPHESQMLHRILPGTMLTLDEQCKRDRGTNACFKDARVCAQLFCFDSASGYCVSYRPAAEGSPCGEGQVCRNGKCVGEIENIIPDYTHQSQVIARRPHSVSALADNGISASSTSTATSPPDGGPKLAAYAQPVLSSRMDSPYSVDASPAQGNNNNNNQGYQSSYRGSRAQAVARATSAKLLAPAGHQSAANIGSQANNKHQLYAHHHHHQSMSATSSSPSYAAKLAPNYSPAVVSSRMDSYNSALDPHTLSAYHQNSPAGHSPAYRPSRASGSKLTTANGASPHHHTPTRRAGDTNKLHTTTTNHQRHHHNHHSSSAPSAAATFK